MNSRAVPLPLIVQKVNCSSEPDTDRSLLLRMEVEGTGERLINLEAAPS